MACNIAVSAEQENPIWYGVELVCDAPYSCNCHAWDVPFVSCPDPTTDGPVRSHYYIYQSKIFIVMKSSMKFLIGSLILFSAFFTACNKESVEVQEKPTEITNT